MHVGLHELGFWLVKPGTVKLLETWEMKFVMYVMLVLSFLVCKG